MRRLLLCLATVLPLLAVPAFAAPHEITGRVISVADGDTITVLASDKRQIKIRVYGIDCPESRQAFGRRAKQAASDAVFGKNVTVRPVETDRYGRTVAVVLMPDGKSLGERLVRDGLAWVYTKYCRQTEICAPLKRLETAARTLRRGLWADKNPVPPWEWRKR